MTPDRNDQYPPDDGEHGVLSETGSIDTSALGLLGAHTEQVSVSLSMPPDDDLRDDDVVDDDIALDSLEADAIEAELIEDDVLGDDEPDGDQGIDHAEADAEAGADAGADAVADAGVDADAAADAELFARSDGQGAARDRDDAPGELPVQAPDADRAAVARTATPLPAATGSIPATRRELQHADTGARARQAERVASSGELTLTPKRLGEFEGGRESSDLLTPDRLLEPSRIVRPDPEGFWQHLLYAVSGKRINLGDGKRARDRKALDRRIAVPLTGGARFVPVLSRKGGVGKTTITMLLGMALADARNDRIIAIDANPDRGTLADRISRVNSKTIRDLVRVRDEVRGYNDISDVVSRDETRLDVLASDADPLVFEALSDSDYNAVAGLTSHYYSIVLTDTGTGIVHSVMVPTLDAAHAIVIVSGLSVDEARLASETLTWLESNGYRALVDNSVVVLNSGRPGTSLVRQDELEKHFRTRVRTVVRMPYDRHLGAGSKITFRDLRPETRLAARQLAAAVVEGLRAEPAA